MSCPKCAELEQQVSYLQNEVEYWNSLYKRERDKNLAGTFEELSGLSAKNKSLTESVASLEKDVETWKRRANSRSELLKLGETTAQVSDVAEVFKNYASDPACPKCKESMSVEQAHEHLLSHAAERTQTEAQRDVLIRDMEARLWNLTAENERLKRETAPADTFLVRNALQTLRRRSSYHWSEGWEYTANDHMNEGSMRLAAQLLDDASLWSRPATQGEKS